MTKKQGGMLAALFVLAFLLGFLGCQWYSSQDAPQRELAFETKELQPMEASWKEENGQLVYTKEYLLDRNEDPDQIPREAFREDGIRWKFLKQEEEAQKNVHKKEYEHPVTFESNSNRMEVLLGMLDDKKEVTTEDGYAGMVYLDTNSIQATAQGYGSKQVMKTNVRQFPNLDGADLSWIPKNITEDGVTYRLKSVDWQTSNVALVDGYEMPNRYTAVVTYEGSVTQKYAKGYTVTAVYRGWVEKTEVEGMKYRFHFIGEREPFWTTLPAKQIGSAAAILFLLGAGVYGVQRIRKNREETKTVEERWGA